MAADDAALTPASDARKTKTPRRDKVKLRAYPKIILLYPTWIAALVGAIVTTIPAWSDPDGVAATRMGLWFLVVASLNLVVLSFDFPRTTSFTLFAFIVAIVLGALWLNTKFTLLQFLSDWWENLAPSANNQFYWFLFTVLSIIYVLVFFVTRFDYWEVMPNEIIHHHGVLGNVNRFPAPQLKLEKEITDVFEFLLLRSGRLLLHPSTERRAIVLENVPNINRRDNEIQALLRVLDVHVHSDRELHDDMTDNA
jgi:hypothetical protein